MSQQTIMKLLSDGKTRNCKQICEELSLSQSAVNAVIKKLIKQKEINHEKRWAGRRFILFYSLAMVKC